jgi:nucleoside phosphorylase
VPAARATFRAIVLTALEVEYSAVAEHLADLEPRPHKGTQYEHGVIEMDEARWEILIAEIGPGNSSAAQEAERAINHFQPDLALFVGVAGGLKDVEVGDVVASDQVYSYHSGKAAETFKPRPKGGSARYDAVQIARTTRRAWNNTRKGRDGHAWVGPLAAGEAVVASKNAPTYRLLKRNYGDALAVEMEGAGFLLACERNNVPALILRGISDLVEGKEASDKSGSQALASKHAAMFMRELLNRWRVPIAPRARHDSPQRRRIRRPSLAAQEPLGQESRSARGPLLMFVSSRMRAGLDPQRRIVGSMLSDLPLRLARAWLWEKDWACPESVEGLITVQPLPRDSSIQIR